MLLRLLLLVAALLPPSLSAAADFPEPRTGVFIAKDFKFNTGETLPEVRLAYTTVGDPTGEPVLMLHGTAGSARTMLGPTFAGELFGAGQPLDARRYFIILPDALGAGASSKPSDGLKAKFPKYNYDDMVDAQYRLVTEGLGIKRLRVVMGNSMGGMHAWVWATRYPDMMDAVVPMASQPTQMSARNWALRRLLVETIKADPDYKDGDYVTQPKFARIASVFYATATNGGDLAYQRIAPTRAAADKLVADRLGAPFPADANDFIWQWLSSADYDPEPLLSRIKARVLAINSADDERNPVITGLTEAALARIPGSTLLVIPASPTTGGQGTTGGQAKLYVGVLGAFLASLPPIAK